jgi:hypothetical protein
MQNILQYRTTVFRLMYTSTIVNFPDINHLLAPRARDLVWQLLLCQRFPRRLDDVHLVPRAGCACGEILQASGAREFKDEMLGAESEAFQTVSHFLRRSFCGTSTYQAVVQTTAL